MKKLFENQLICLLSRNELRTELSDDELQVLFDDFTIALTQMRDAENSNEEIFRTLNYTKVFCALKISPNEVKKNVQIINLAIRLIDNEIELMHLKMQYPNYFSTQESSFKSPLFWEKDHPKIELNGILCGMEKTGRIVTVDGAKASLTLIVKSAEEFLNIKLGDPQEIKRAVFRRKISITKFTDAIRNALLNYSKELDR